MGKDRVREQAACREFAPKQPDAGSRQAHQMLLLLPLLWWRRRRLLLTLCTLLLLLHLLLAPCQLAVPGVGSQSYQQPFSRCQPLLHLCRQRLAFQRQRARRKV